MRAAEAAAIAAGTPVEILMERAGMAAAEAIWRYAGPLPVLVLCGPGNNGGDGYVVARELRARGVAVRVAALSEPKGGAARAACELWGGPVEPLAEAAGAPLLVDALFGTGLGRPLAGAVAQAPARPRRTGRGPRRHRPAERRRHRRRAGAFAGSRLRSHHHLPDFEALAPAAAGGAAHGADRRRRHRHRGGEPAPRDRPPRPSRPRPRRPQI